MYINNKLLIGKNEEQEICILPKLVNRHGLITGASGSGKTTSVKVLAETFSESGIPVMMIDVKGDLSGTCKCGIEESWITNSISKLNIEGFNYKAYPVCFFDVFKENGLPLRTTINSIGSKLLSKMLGLTDAQEGILAIAFKISEDEELKLINLNDLKELLTYIGENKDDYILKYGNITTASIAAIQRNILELEQEGGNNFFGEPALELYDLLQYDMNGKGFINILDAQILYKNPTLYACVLVYLLTTLYDNMPEVGDLDRPKLALFLDEAHIIFSEMSSELTKKIIQIIKLIRSKGIGIYFISQSPSDIPEEILGQLGNKIQHVLRSYTPSDEKSVKAAANSFRSNPNFNTAEAIKSLATGEALVSFLNEKGEPNIVERCFILPPSSYTSTVDDTERQNIIKSSRCYMKYINDVNNESAEEKVVKEREKREEEKQRLEEEKAEAKRKEQEAKEAAKEAERKAKEEAKAAEKKAKEEEKAKEKKRKQATKVFKQVGNKVMNKATTKVVNSLWKSIFK